MQRLAREGRRLVRRLERFIRDCEQALDDLTATLIWEGDSGDKRARGGAAGEGAAGAGDGAADPR